MPRRPLPDGPDRATRRLGAWAAFAAIVLVAGAAFLGLGYLS